MYDVYLAPTKKAAPGAVLVSVTDEDAARTLVDALKSVQESLFQCEGLKPWYRGVNREASTEPESEDQGAASTDTDPEEQPI